MLRGFETRFTLQMQLHCFPAVLRKLVRVWFCPQSRQVVKCGVSPVDLFHAVLVNTVWWFHQTAGVDRRMGRKYAPLTNPSDALCPTGGRRGHWCFVPWYSVYMLRRRLLRPASVSPKCCLSQGPRNSIGVHLQGRGKGCVDQVATESIHLEKDKLAVEGVKRATKTVDPSARQGKAARWGVVVEGTPRHGWSSEVATTPFFTWSGRYDKTSSTYLRQRMTKEMKGRSSNSKNSIKRHARTGERGERATTPNVYQ